MAKPTLFTFLSDGSRLSFTRVLLLCVLFFYFMFVSYLASSVYFASIVYNLCVLKLKKKKSKTEMTASVHENKSKHTRG